MNNNSTLEISNSIELKHKTKKKIHLKDEFQREQLHHSLFRAEFSLHGEQIYVDSTGSLYLFADLCSDHERPFNKNKKP